ncbi:MAG: DUF883 family protein [Betaproteobacteria bacterium]|nr:DUF883 family protein [Betaproteobacteria bacterium]
MNTRIDRLVDEVRGVTDDAEALVRASAGQVGEQARHAAERVERSVATMRSTLAAWGGEASAAAGRTATRARQEVEDHPWAAVGVAAVAGIVLGLLIRRK